MIKKSSDHESVELVITPPEQYGAHLTHLACARTTLGVLTQLIAGAKIHIVIVSPFLQASEGLGASPLADAIKYALRRGVLLDVISTRMGIDIFKTGWSALLGNGNIRLFQPKPNIDDERLLGSHAKVLIVDRKHAYIGSANLTRPGLTDNLEMGVLVHGYIAIQAASFWEYLANIKFLIEVPI